MWECVFQVCQVLVFRCLIFLFIFLLWRLLKGRFSFPPPKKKKENKLQVCVWGVPGVCVCGVHGGRSASFCLFYSQKASQRAPLLQSPKKIYKKNEETKSKQGHNKNPAQCFFYLFFLPYIRRQTAQRTPLQMKEKRKQKTVN